MDSSKFFWFTVIMGVLVVGGIGYAAGPAVVDDVIGVYNFPWFNATVGMYSPRVIGDEYFLGTDNVTDHLTASLVEPASYIIYKDGATYYAKKGTDGSISSGAVFTTLFETSMASTPAEGKIVLIGDFIATSEIDVVSNIEIELHGTITQGYEGHVYDLQGNGNIFIHGGKIIGDKGTYNSDKWNGIKDGTGTANVTLKDIEIYGFEGKGAMLRANNHYIQNCIFHHNDQDGLYLFSVSTNNATQIICCESYLNGGHGFNAEDVINIEYSMCMSYHNTGDGYHFESDNDGSTYITNVMLDQCQSHHNSDGIEFLYSHKDITLSNCKSYNNSAQGLRFRAHDTALSSNCQVNGGQYYCNGQRGVLVEYYFKLYKLIGVQCWDNDVTGGGYAGIRFDEHGTASRGIDIIGCSSYDTGRGLQNKGIKIDMTDAYVLLDGYFCVNNTVTNLDWTPGASDISGDGIAP